MAVCSLIRCQGFVLRLPPRPVPLLQFVLHVPEETQFVQDVDLLLAQLALPSSCTLCADPLAQSGVPFVQGGYAAMAMLLLECDQSFQPSSPVANVGISSRAGRQQAASLLPHCGSQCFFEMSYGHFMLRPIPATSPSTPYIVLKYPAAAPPCPTPSSCRPRRPASSPW